MSPGVDSPDYRITPMDISKAIGKFKVSNVIVEVFSNEHKWWDRYSNCSSLTHDIIGIQAYGIQKDRWVYLSLKECVGHSSNIDREMMDTISKIEFWKEG